MPTHDHGRGVSTVLPVYWGASALERLVNRASRVLRDADVSFEVLLVDDASPAPTRELAHRLAQTAYGVTLLGLSGNVNQRPALLAGVEAGPQGVITMADDLQRSLEAIPLVLEDFGCPRGRGGTRAARLFREGLRRVRRERPSMTESERL